MPNTQEGDCHETIEEQLALLETLFQNAPAGYAFVDRDFRYVRVNDALTAINSMPANNLIGKTVEEAIPQLWPTLAPLYRRALSGETILNQDISDPNASLDAQQQHWLVSYYPVRLQQEIIGIGVIVNDITMRKQAEKALATRNNLYAMLARTNRAVSQCKSCEELYREVCAIAVETGKFRFAWIGVPDGDRVKVVASTGIDGGYMDELVITLTDDDPRSRGPAGMCLRSGQPIITNDFMTSPMTAPWHQLARRAGFAASAAFPLKEQGEVIALLSLHAGVRDFFTDDLIETLREISISVSFGLDAFVHERDRRRDEMERRQLEEQLKMLHEVSLLLSQSDSPDALCRRAIELGRERFGFDRLSLWVITDNPDMLKGTYGTDEQGGTRVEYGRSMLSMQSSRQDLFADSAVHITKDWPLSDDRGERVGRGWHMMAALRDGVEVIGVLNADNYLRQQPLREHQVELLGLYGAIIGHQYARLQREQALRTSEARFRAIFAGAAVGIALVDQNGHPVMSNTALHEMLGYGEEELRGMAFTEFTHPDHVDLDWNSYRELVAGKRESYQIEKRYICKGGSVIWGRLTVSLVRDIAGEPQFAIGMVENITERKTAEQSLRNSLMRLHTLTSHLQSVREEERERVAREVHDELGQALTGLKIELAWVRRQMTQKRPGTPDEPILEKIDSMYHLINATIQSVRRIITELRPVILDTLGLAPALEWQAHDFQERTGIQCVFLSTLDTLSLDRERTIAVFRIAQESLTNVLRHARATRVEIGLESREEMLILTVQDNGIGIKDADLTGSRSFGLLGMHERALLLGGDIQIVGTPRRGTMVRLLLPLDLRQESGDAILRQRGAM
jgi:PAS domain S-box-containing protein